jgi:hypothetical protein
MEMKMRNLMLTLACATGLAIAGTAKADSQVVNGGFETGSFSGWTLTGIPSYSLVASFSMGSYHAYEGSDYAMLGSYGAESYLSQTVGTTPGDWYSITYALASDGGAPSEFTVLAGNDILSDVSNLPKSDYVLDSSPAFQAVSSSTTIEFGSRDDPGYLLLDDVSIGQVSGPTPIRTTSAVPLPSSVWMGSALMTIIGAAAFRKSRIAAI